MPWRSRAIASTRSSRSASSVLCWVSISPSSSSARRLTAPSRSRSRRRRSSSCSTVATSGRIASGSMPASPPTASGSTSSISWISWATSVSRRLAPSTRSSARAASSRAAPSASSAARTARSRRGQRVLGFGQTIGRGGARRFRGLHLGDQRAALFLEHRRRIGERRALLLGLGAAGVERGDLRDRAVAALAPGGAVGADGVEAAVGQLGLARQRLGLGAHLGELAPACPRCRCGCRRAVLPGRPTAAARPARVSARRVAAWASSRPAISRVLASVSAETRAVLRATSRSAMACSSRALSASRCAARHASRAAASAAPAAVSSDCAASTALRLSVDVGAGGDQLAVDVGQAAALRQPPRGAGRRVGVGGEAVPAPEIAVAGHEPLAGLEQRREPRAVGALDDADLGETPRQLRRRLDVLRQRLRALRQGRIGRIDARAHPAHRVASGRPARRDRRRARRRARSRSPSRR